MPGKKEAALNQAAREAAAARGRTTFLFACAVLASSILLCVYIWQYTRMVEIQTDISKQERQIREAREKLQYLLLEREMLARLERIDFTAQERLNMIVPGSENLRYLPVSVEPSP